MNQEQQKKEAKKLPSFYIALCCCVLAIGAAGYIAEKRSDEASTVMNTESVTENTLSEEYASSTIPPDVPIKTPSMQANETEENTVQESGSESDGSLITESTTVTESVSAAENGSSENVSSMSETEAAAEYTIDNPDIQSGAITVSSEQPAFIMPIMGDILEAYSDQPSFNAALSDWRTHNGIDISADKGCSVQSAADGIVDEISDNIMGSYVVISHSAGLVTKYMGLEHVENLTVGKEVKSGEVIGTVGDCKGENVTQPHLHFEITKDNEFVNPSDYLPH